MNKKRSLRMSIIIMVAILMLIIFCGGLYISYLQSNLTDALKQNLMENANQSQITVSTKINSHIRELEELSNIITCLEFDTKEQILDFFRNYNNKTFYRFAIIDSQGMGYSPDVRKIDLSQRKYFQTAMNGTSNISQIDSDIITGTLESNYAVPIYNKQDEITFVLVGSRAISSMSDILNVPFCDDEGYILLADKNGKIILNSSHPNYNPNLKELSQYGFVAGQAPKGILKGEIFNQKRGYYDYNFMAYLPLSVNDWYVVSIVPADIVSDSMMDICNTAIATWAFLTIAFAGVMLYFIHSYGKYNKQIEKIAFEDTLTKRGNWNKFASDSKILFEKYGVDKYSVVIFDIDKFKLINDKYGYIVGDETLINISNILDKALSEDECFTRLNADNFIFLTKNRDSQSIIKKLYDINREIKVSDLNYKIILSCGIYIIEENDISDINIVVDKSRLAKKSVKGTNNLYGIYSRTLLDSMFEEKEIENDMEKALENQEFLIYLQPKYRFSDEKIVGAEALIRWQHPAKGMIYPNNFIPIFERNGFIKEIDFYMLRKACEFLYTRNELEDDFSISVNFSRVHLHNDNLAKQIKEVVDYYSLPTSYIEIELTESTIFDNIPTLQNILAELKSYGFKISMDDFGSGYSSLNSLKDLQVDILKFDRGFLQTSSSSQRGKYILETMLEMAKKLNMVTVAEGVEELEQVTILKQMGCDIAQGYYYSKPLSIAEFEKLIKR